MKYFVLVAVVLALSAATASAAPTFSINLLPEKDVIFTDEAAYFTLLIENNANVTDTFTVFTTDFDWRVDASELNTIDGGNVERVLLELQPKVGIKAGPRSISVNVRSSNTNEIITTSALVSVRSPDSGNRTYLPSIFLNAQVPANVDPREDLSLSVYMRNRNARDYEKLTVLASSDLFTKEYTTSLGPIGEEGEKTNQLGIPLDPYTPPGEHNLLVRIVVDDAVVNEYRTRFTVQAYRDAPVTSERSGSVFRYVTTYAVTNNGNQQEVISVSHPTSFFKRLFTDASAQYEVVREDESGALAFTVTLDPRQTAEITVTENYRLLVILAVLVLLSVVSYYLFRSPIVLRKEALIVGSSADGVSQMKIRLFIKNRSAKPVHNLHIVDRVTSMADVVKQHTLGTLQPTKIITKKGHGTLVRWDLDTLEPFEERIITYTVSTQLKLIGDVYLPAMKIKFDQGGRERTSYSNEVNIPREG